MDHDLGVLDREFDEHLELAVGMEPRARQEGGPAQLEAGGIRAADEDRRLAGFPHQQSQADGARRAEGIAARAEPRLERDAVGPDERAGPVGEGDRPLHLDRDVLVEVHFVAEVLGAVGQDRESGLGRGGRGQEAERDAQLHGPGRITPEQHDPQDRVAHRGQRAGVQLGGRGRVDEALGRLESPALH